MTAQSPTSHFDTSSEAQSRRRGRVKGNRTLLADKFFAATYAAWEEQGDAALRRFAFHDPGGYCNMVARLMPQKIEHTTPTDGLSDERLAQLLEIAERAVELRTIDVTPSHEKTALLNSPQGRGGGPELDGDAAGGGSTSTSRGVFTDEQSSDPNKLKGSVPLEVLVALTPESVYDDRTPVTPYRSENAIPHPVGRPFPPSDCDVAARNKAALEAVAAEPIDPSSLF